MEVGLVRSERNRTARSFRPLSPLISWAIVLMVPMLWDRLKTFQTDRALKGLPHSLR
jgi:hypothetical protein